ncbi:hypothetical protein VNO78_13588 [Psophocarpus tetragonolobus]|uniref:Uncharacterized protein n=1 Tax=Psophocarpus tetragonolobus TaxID=3891 RepID=A0AAN9SZ06_PSOTE
MGDQFLSKLRQKELVGEASGSDEWSDLEVGETMASGDGVGRSMKDNREVEESHEDGNDNSLLVALDRLAKGADLNEHFLNTEAFNNERSLLHDGHIGSLQFQCGKNLDGVKEKNKPITCLRVDGSLAEAMAGAAVNSSDIMAHANYKEAIEITCSNRAVVCKGEMLWVRIGDPSVEHLEDIALNLVAGIENVVGSSAFLGTSHKPVLSQHFQSTQPL